MSISTPCASLVGVAGWNSSHPASDFYIWALAQAPFVALKSNRHFQGKIYLPYFSPIHFDEVNQTINVLNEIQLPRYKHLVALQMSAESLTDLASSCWQTLCHIYQPFMDVSAPSNISNGIKQLNPAFSVWITVGHPLLCTFNWFAVIM